MPVDQRLKLFAWICAVCLLVSVGYVWARAQQTAAAFGPFPDEAPVAPSQPIATIPSDEPDPVAAAPGDAETISASPVVLFRNGNIDKGYGQVAVLSLDNLAAPRLPTGLRCERVYFAGRHGMCLSADRGAITTYHATLFGPDLKTEHQLPLQGIPSRTRLSPDGRYAAVTVFVSGHSYAPGSFSTRTEIYETATGELVVELEQLTIERDGKLFREIDFNFWGVTFAADGQRFYATLASRGENYLIEGNLAERKGRVIHSRVECPSLSPDGTRVAFKRLQPSGWQIYVLDLTSGEEWPLAETRSVDDQVEWLDDGRLLYGVSNDIWVVPADGSGEPTVFLPQASSPAVLR